jgi:hypothetical protein
MIGGVSGERLPGGYAVDAGRIEIELPTSLTAEGVRRFQERDRIAAIAAARTFPAPGPVLICVGRQQGRSE